MREFAKPLRLLVAGAALLLPGLRQEVVAQSTPNEGDLACCVAAGSTPFCSVQRSEDCLTGAALPIPGGICCELPLLADTCTGNACDTGLPGICQAGNYECVEGQLACTQLASPEPEVCGDDADNDCNGFVDEECTFEGILVDGRANIFGAGHTTLPGGGVAPPGVSLNVAPGSVVVLPSVTGSVSGWASGCALNGPDGGQACGSSTNVASSMGISGIVHEGRTMFLTGVFLAAEEPTDPAPPRLTFSSAQDFTDLSPEIGQTFFVGDGRDLNGEVQQFHVPAGATRLFLGFAETFRFSTGGTPGAYNDNGGSLTVTLAVTPP